MEKSSHSAGKRGETVDTAVNSKHVPLAQLLDWCSDRSSPNFEAGWRLFLKSYKRYIYKIVSKRCSRWEVTRLDLQFSDVVNDIVTEVLLLLCDHDGGILNSFRARDNERMFLAWLATVTDRMAVRHLRRYFSKLFTANAADDFRNILGAMQPFSRWELYETVVQYLRGLAGPRKRNLERDIHLFMLYNWADFSEDMIRVTPNFRSMGDRVLDNVINRLRILTRNNLAGLR